jgi:2-polyprenyl-6-methoxyphenol hydroxylase-like FAD-dependent oxidoreductase
VEKAEHVAKHWKSCQECSGQGKRSRRLRKKVRLQYQRELSEFERTNQKGAPPIRPKRNLYTCLNCNGSGLTRSNTTTLTDYENFPHIAIIGGGIGGVALAVACLHRGIPFTLFERDNSFDERSQGYGLTLQQASKAIAGFGISNLKNGIISTRHLVHTTDGKVIGEWGMRKWMHSENNKSPRRTNIHISRQSLRLALLNQLGKNNIQWGHQLIALKEHEDKKVELHFQVGEEIKISKTDLVVGADGIRSAVRNFIIGEKNTPLQYLGCIVILVICPLKNLENIDSHLLDSATVFQTVNGHERVYMMPYDTNSIMWQLSFPMAEKTAKKLSLQGAEALKEEACQRTQWHSPIPEIIATTSTQKISGYPVYDRDLLNKEHLEKRKKITLLGDAAHPMSPFKGQGANQALLDALALARGIAKGCKPQSNWRDSGIRQRVLTEFETEMLSRSAIKVKDSAAAAKFLHSETVLQKADEPRGRCIKNNDKTL